MNPFHFLRPEWFYALIPLLIISVLLFRLKARNRGWQSFCDEKLLPYLLKDKPTGNSRNLTSLVFIAGIILITALAGPTWEQRQIPVFKNQSALVIILDLSASMDAGDIKPSRLTRARHKIEDILKRRKEGQTALIVFAGEAFTVTPLTDDTETIASQVKSLSTSLMPVQGSNSNSALMLALKLLNQASQLNGDILMITDGIDAKSLKTVNKITAKGHRVSVLAIGTEDAAPIPQAGGGFLKDSNGSIIVPAVDFKQLAQLAAAGHGQIQTLTTSDDDINALLKPVQQLDIKDDTKATELNTDTWYETGPYLVLLLIPLAAFAFRKGYIAMLVFFILPLSPQPAQAYEWSALWKNENQQAAELLKNNKPDEAAQQFTDPEWKAAAQYKAGQYQQALQTYNNIGKLTSEALYNKANTLAKLGQVEEAIKTYDEVLAQNAAHADAKYNRDLLKQQQQNQQSDNKDQQQKDSQDKSQSSDNNENDQQNSDNQQQSDNSESDQNATDEQQKNKSEKEKEKQSESEPDNSKQTSEANKNKDEDNQQPEQKNIQQADDSNSEQQQATEQWLRRIPDDPGGLLKRKFKYQSDLRQHERSQSSGQSQW